jgi:hypothetical protein
MAIRAGAEWPLQLDVDTSNFACLPDIFNGVLIKYMRPDIWDGSEQRFTRAALYTSILL